MPERLDYERQVIFSPKFSLGQRQLVQVVQKDPLCLGADSPVNSTENRRWTVVKVTYATINIQGSCNNLCDTAPEEQEYEARNTASIAWMKKTFTEAKARNSVAVMFISQGNPGWDLYGYQDFLLALRDETIAFRRLVAYVHGDWHYHRIDKPFQDAQGRRLENFTRVETFGNSAANGNNEVQWVKVIVNPRSREVFSYQAQIVTGNRVAVPVP